MCCLSVLSSHLTSTSESGLIGNVRNDDVRSIAQVNRIIENVFLITIDNGQECF